MAHLSKDGYSHIHYDNAQARTISVREAARLQSFPDGFVFSGAMNEAFRQIGNAVPPLMARALAAEVMRAIQPRKGAHAAITSPKKGGLTDVLTPEQRRLVMSRIRGKDTKPELILRRGLHQCGLRYGLHRADMAGKPDMVFPRHRAVVFVHGCFWHGHGCSLFRWPKTRATFWRTKINRNMERDRRVLAALNADGWRALVVWECALRGRHARATQDVLAHAEAFIRQDRESVAEIGEYANEKQTDILTRQPATDCTGRNAKQAHLGGRPSKDEVENAKAG